MKKKAFLTSLLTLLCCFVGFAFAGCEFPPDHEHEYTKQVATAEFKASDATCQQNATYYYSCSCGEKGTTTFEAGEKGQHNYVDYVYNNNATCSQNGTETAICSTSGCNETDTREKADTALGHSYTNYVYNNNATCSQNGTETAICSTSGCNETDTREKADTALGHSYTNYVYNNNATCTQNGTETAICNNGCGINGTREKADTALGHSYTNYVYNNNATCSQNGTETAICNNGCGISDIREKVDTALGHSYINYVYNNNATCTQNGTETSACENGCGISDTREKAGTALGHKYENYIYNNNATCEQNGTETAVCSALGCNAINTREKVDSALGHSYGTPSYVWNNDQCTATRVCGNDNTHIETETATGEYKKDADATCTESEKGHYEVTFINGAFAKQVTETGSETKGSPLGHNYTNYVYNNNATCEQNGTETAICNNGCETTDTREKANTALSHSYGEPTYQWTNNICTATRVCRNDNTHIETETATGEYKKDADATCTEPEKGHYEVTFINGAFTSQETQSVSVGNALGHNFVDGECDRCEEIEPVDEKISYEEWVSAFKFENVTIERYQIVEDEEFIEGTYLIDGEDVAVVYNGITQILPGQSYYVLEQINVYASFYTLATYEDGKYNITYDPQIPESTSIVYITIEMNEDGKVGNIYNRAVNTIDEYDEYGNVIGSNTTEYSYGYRFYDYETTVIQTPENENLLISYEEWQNAFKFENVTIECYEIIDNKPVAVGHIFVNEEDAAAVYGGMTQVFPGQASSVLSEITYYSNFYAIAEYSEGKYSITYSSPDAPEEVGYITIVISEDGKIEDIYTRVVGVEYEYDEDDNVIGSRPIEYSYGYRFYDYGTTILPEKVELPISEEKWYEIFAEEEFDNMTTTVSFRVGENSYTENIYYCNGTEKITVNEIPNIELYYIDYTWYAYNAQTGEHGYIDVFGEMYPYTTVSDAFKNFFFMIANMYNYMSYNEDLDVYGLDIESLQISLKIKDNKVVAMTSTMDMEGETQEYYYTISNYGLTSFEIPFEVDFGGNEEFDTTIFNYTIDDEDGICIIDGLMYNDGNPGIIIPEYIEGYPVTKIADYAFMNCEWIVSVEIPNTVDYIGKNAFEGCTSLAIIQIPESVEWVGSYAFYNCSSVLIYVFAEQQLENWHINWNVSLNEDQVVFLQNQD